MRECNRDVNKDCKSRDEVITILKHLYFNVFVTEQFYSFENWSPGDNPIIQIEKLLTTFQVRNDDYHENTSLIMINDLYTTVSRWKVWKAAKLWNYIKLGTEISWIGSNFVSQDNQTSDGINFHVRTDTVF